ncbi:hypothetical protein FUA23_18510 [Neolewinella aurantiaca]|uniref:Uncharacterized protein n=1 Tax=Neolewinella aurantiaca TaxID=2602767 RepID=A0A5C7FDK3_9BACT|nr:hypothetical protein [Neolewinella aurantiaca]TXF87578.1 hypothetical protein FUA23_18510 [Neolewinella aurantiaca]
MDEQRDPYDGDYVGNIFGWKLSMYGLVIILAFCALAAYRHYTMDVPVGFDDPLEAQKDRFAPAGAADRAKAEAEARDTLDLQ